MLFALLVLLSSQFANGEKIVCNGLVFHDVYFDRETLVENLGRPYNLVMHKFSNVLFFSHTVQNGTYVDFSIMSCEIDSKKCKEIQGVPGGYAIAYDAGNDDIYFGGHDGIYKYNFLNKSAEFFFEEGKSIWGLFVRKNFYYIEYPTQKLYVYHDDKFEQVAEATDIEIDNFFVSKPGDIYFSNQTALYKVDKITRINIVLDDEVVVRQIVEDRFGDVYFCANDGIYMELRPYHSIKKIAHIDHAFGLAFDENDHIVYSDKEAIYRLLPSNNTEVCYNLIYNFKDDDEKFKDRLIS